MSDPSTRREQALDNLRRAINTEKTDELVSLLLDVWEKLWNVKWCHDESQGGSDRHDDVLNAEAAMDAREVLAKVFEVSPEEQLSRDYARLQEEFERFKKCHHQILGELSRMKPEVLREWFETNERLSQKIAP